MSEKFEPERDERVTQIVVIELLQKSAEQAKIIGEGLDAILQGRGWVRDVDYMLTVGQPDDLLSNPNLTDFMSGKQEGFLTKLINDLRPLIGRYKTGLDRQDRLDPEVYAQAETVMSVVFQELDSHIRAKREGKGTISPRRASELIDATKRVIEDMQGELNGV